MNIIKFFILFALASVVPQICCAQDSIRTPKNNIYEHYVVYQYTFSHNKLLNEIHSSIREAQKEYRDYAWDTDKWIYMNAFHITKENSVSMSISDVSFDDIRNMFLGEPVTDDITIFLIPSDMPQCYGIAKFKDTLLALDFRTTKALLKTFPFEQTYHIKYAIGESIPEKNSNDSYSLKLELIYRKDGTIEGPIIKKNSPLLF